MRNIVKTFIFEILDLFAPPSPDAACIYMYHSVGSNQAFFTVTAAAFEKQIRYLIDQKYTMLFISELVSRLERGESIHRTVSLTFDDGYADSYEIVFPILKKYGVHASVFLTTGRIGSISNDPSGALLPFLSEEQIREMRSSGLVEFLPHGEHHTKLAGLSKKDARDEILTSAARCSESFGSSERIFAYPSGSYSSETIEILSEEDFRAAVTVRPGLVTMQSARLELPRNHVDSETSFAEFRARLSRAGEWYERTKSMVRK